MNLSKSLVSVYVLIASLLVVPLVSAQEGQSVSLPPEMGEEITVDEVAGASAVSAQETTTSTATTTEEQSEPQPGYAIEALGSDEVIGDFVVGPGKTELRMKPGESRTVELLISNRMGEVREFNFEIEDVTGSNNADQAVVLLGDDRGPYTLKDYIKLPALKFDLNHAERARVPVTVTIPPDAEPGGRYGSVLVTTVTKSSKDEANGAVPKSALISRIGTLFFVIIDGDLAVDGKLDRFETLPKKSWFTEGPIHFGLYYQNSGSVHLNPYGEIRVENMFGEEVGFVQVDPWFALPKSLRFREIEWSREFLLGKYKAIAHINRGYDDIVDTLEYEFWVVPWKLLAIGLGGVFVCVFLLRLFFKTFEFKRKGSG